MNSKSLIWGMVGTVIWLLIIFLFSILKGYELPNSLNELGDALAGIVAPIAFFWLILGYVQQGKQLEQNTKALEQQEKALQLQIDEMRESVSQQKALTNIQKEQMESQKKIFKPFLSIKTITCNVYQEYIDEFDQTLERYLCFVIDIEVENADIRNLTIFDKDNIALYELAFLQKNLSKKIDISLDIDKEYITVKDEKLESIINFQYQDSFENQFAEFFVFGVGFDPEMGIDQDLGTAYVEKYIDKAHLSEL